MMPVLFLEDRHARACAAKNGESREGMLDGFSLGSYLLLVDYTSRLCRNGKARISRSSRLLSRMIDNLEDYLGGMRSLKLQGMNEGTNDKNIAVVEDNLVRWRKELTAVEQTIQNAPLTDRSGSLGAAANDRFTEYRSNFAGQSRESRDHDLLNRIVEDLTTIARSMDAIDAEDGDDQNAANLQIVLDRVRLYEREYGMIREAKQGGVN